jgi:hypothetical protein
MNPGQDRGFGDAFATVSDGLRIDFEGDALSEFRNFGHVSENSKAAADRAVDFERPRLAWRKGPGERNGSRWQRYPGALDRLSKYASSNAFPTRSR